MWTIKAQESMSKKVSRKTGFKGGKGHEVRNVGSC